MMMTRSSTLCEPGAVVLVRFRFTRYDKAKKRPAVILSVAEYQYSRADAVMVALTTKKLDVGYFGDCVLGDWRSAGLPQASKAKGVLQTIEQATVERRLGSLTAEDLARVKFSVRDILGL